MRCVFCFLSRVLLIISLSPKTSLGALEMAPFLISAPAEQITSRGQNRQALFVDNGQIVFVSRERKRNEDPQIYLKNLTNGQERQLTHQRGLVQISALLPKQNKIIYSSTTDEEKESPLALKKYLDRFPSSIDHAPFVFLDLSPQEIYISDLQGIEIERLTEWSGFDGFATYKSDGDQIYFSRLNKNKLGLYTQLNKVQSTAWPVLKSDAHDLGIQYSPQTQKFVWSRFSPDFNNSELMIADPRFKKVTSLTTLPGVYWGAQFHPNGKSVIYSAKLEPMNNFDLFEADIHGKCHRQISSFEGDEYFPAINPEGNKIIFTSTQAGGEQIFMMDYPTPLECP
jgi:Tol biopolymer transport system component